jgi:hypothetical protein
LVPDAKVGYNSFYKKAYRDKQQELKRKDSGRALSNRRSTRRRNPRHAGIVDAPNKLDRQIQQFKNTLLRLTQVPKRYRGNSRIEREQSGSINIYFGGKGGNPLGPDHGHYVIYIMAVDILMTYHRKRGAPKDQDYKVNVYIIPNKRTWGNIISVQRSRWAQLTYAI